MKKIRGLKRKLNQMKIEYVHQLEAFNEYSRLYVPQLTYVDGQVKGMEYTLYKFLFDHTLDKLPADTYYMYILNEQYPMNSHFILSKDKILILSNLEQEEIRGKPGYIQSLEQNYQMSFEKYHSIPEDEEPIETLWVYKGYQKYPPLKTL